MYDILDEVSITRSIRYNGQRAKTVITVFWVVIAFTVISTIVTYMQYSILSDIRQGTVTSLKEANLIDTMIVLVSVLNFALSLTTIIVFIQWFRRAYNNLHLLKIKCSDAEGWAAGAWFVPIINLFKPFTIMSEIWQKTQYAVKSIGVNNAKGSTIIGIWWAFYLVSNFIAYTSIFSIRKKEDIDSLIQSDQMNIVSNVFSLIAAYLVIRIVMHMKGVEQKLYDQDPDEEPAQ